MKRFSRAPLWQHGLFLFTVLVLLCFAQQPTQAQTVAFPVTVSWPTPTLNTDGSPVMPIVRTVVEYSQCAGVDMFSGTSAGSAVAAWPLTSVVIDLPAGNWAFRAYYRATAEIRSDNSAVKCLTVGPTAPPPVVLPQPPGNLTVTTPNLAVYNLNKAADKLVFNPVGTVPANTPCDSNNFVRDPGRDRTLNAVPRSAVSWASMFTRPQVVFALCAG